MKLIIVFLLLSGCIAFIILSVTALCRVSADVSGEERYYDDLAQEAAIREYFEEKARKKEGREKRRKRKRQLS